MIRLSNVDGSNPQGGDTIPWGGGSVFATFTAATPAPGRIKVSFQLTGGPFRFFGGSDTATVIEDSGAARDYRIPLQIVRLEKTAVPRVDVDLTAVEIDAQGGDVGRSKRGVFSLTPPLLPPPGLEGIGSMGRALRQRRRELGMSQQALAEHVGLARSTISRMERGLRCSSASCAKVGKIL